MAVSAVAAEAQRRFAREPERSTSEYPIPSHTVGDAHAQLRSFSRRSSSPFPPAASAAVSECGDPPGSGT